MTLLNVAFTASMKTTTAVSFIQGVAIHLLVSPYKIDSWGWPIVLCYFALLAFIFSGYIYVGCFGVLAALGRTFITSTAMNMGIFSSIILYRSFFHRLRHFPGPYLAKLSRFYFTFQATKSLQNMCHVQKLHAKYGDFVRTGPRELSINRPSAIKAIYGPPAYCKKSPWYDQVSDDSTKNSVHFTSDEEVHRNRKRTWERGLGFRALDVYKPRVMDKTVMLMNIIEKNRSKPIDINEYSMFYGFDVMGDVGFSKDFNMLETGKMHPAIQGLHNSMTTIGIFGTVPWLLSMIVKVPFLAGPHMKFLHWCYKELWEKCAIIEREKTMLEHHDPQDVMSWIILARDRNDRSAPPSDQAMEEDSRLLVVAGSDTTSLCLASTIYYLILNPLVYRKLQMLVNKAIPGGEKEWNYEAVKTIPFIDHILQESLRLHPPVPGGLTRVSPPEGLVIDGVFVPGNTIVGVPTWTIQRDNRYWDRPLEYIPERWETLTTDQAPWIPFSRGQNLCPGRNLFYMELRMVLSQIALRYDLAFAPGYDHLEFERNSLDCFTLVQPELPVVFKPVH